jgi:hypothetical protein
MSEPDHDDFTRWNRAGLSRFQYLDGNAAVFLERLRAGLAQRFPAWGNALEVIPESETEEARKTRMAALYARDPDDMLWQLTRQLARACHVLGVHIDAYANEGYLGTASQWENLRRLVALLDYAPLPPASASVPLALILKENNAGTVAAGLQLRHQPDEGAPIVFETLADLDADAAFNRLYPKDHLRNPGTLQGTSLVLAGRIDNLRGGEPLVLEDERNGNLSAHLLEGIIAGDDSTRISLTPSVPAGFKAGWTLVHLRPKERLKPLGPASNGVDHLGHTLQLAVPSTDLAAGDIVHIASANDKPYYRRIKRVHEDRLVFYRAVGALTLNGATVGRPVTLPLTDLADPPARRRIEQDGSVLDVVYAAGDWSRLAGLWLADIRKLISGGGEREYLPMYACLHAKYVPVGTDAEQVADDERPGYTALTLSWHPGRDGVPEDLDFKLDNPQSLLAPPPATGAWTVDRFLNLSANGKLPADLITDLSKKTAAGDLAVVMKGAQMSWSRLANVALDQEHEEATLTAESTWRHRGGGPYFLARTRVFSHFQNRERVLGWQDNDTELSGKRVVLETLPSGLQPGRALILDNASSVLETTVDAVDDNTPSLTLADALPDGTIACNLVIYGNVVDAGHGVTRPERVLGSGDATRSHQQFKLDAVDLSFIADAAMTAGVRADLTLKVMDETWTQVDNLKDSGPTDKHYQVRLDEDNKATIGFGDGRNGRRLPSGGNNVRVGFRQGSGGAGNLAPGALTKLVKPHALLDEVLQPIESSGGADRESNDDLRTNAASTLLALGRAVSLEDFSKLARGHSSIWQARAFRLPPGLGRRERVRVVVVAAGGGTLSAALKQELQDYFIARTQPGVDVSVSDYQRLAFKLRVRLRVRSDAFDPQQVADDVMAALAEAFAISQRKLGQALYRGEVYKVVDNLTGVENSDCSITLGPGTVAALKQVGSTGGEIQVARPGPDQCLVLDANGVDAQIEEHSL